MGTKNTFFTFIQTDLCNTMNTMTTPKTDFGFQEVDTDQKPKLVQDLFGRVADSYDLMNDIMSMGMHRIWKAKFIQMLPMVPDTKLLDVASGTGDIILRYARKAERAACPVHLTAYDCTEDMLHKGRDRAINENLWQSMEWHCGMAETLSFADDAFDLYTIAFGLRNVTDKSQALREAHRVLKPGAGFFCLEFGPSQSGVLQKIYDAYSFHVIPRMGAWVASDSTAYEYLVESIRRFPEAEDLKAMLVQAGFENVYYVPLMGGIAHIHIGWKAHA